MTDKLRVLDLFSGIGGFSLGLERTGGFETAAFCEIDPFCQKVLRKHWPGVPVYSDVRWLRGYMFPTIDVITGGFPCQDISEAGRRAGIDGERSGLWREIIRLMGEIRPKHTLLENVPELLVGDNGGWFGRILRELAALGYDAEWHCIQASDLGAGHIRDRVWISPYVPDPARKWRLKCWREQFAQSRAPAGDVYTFSDEPMPPRVADGVPNRLDRLRSLGNAVVPQIPELIGRAILEVMQ